MDTGNSDHYPSDKYFEEKCVIHWIDLHSEQCHQPFEHPGPWGYWLILLFLH